GILITTIASKGELQNWPELLPKLCSLLDSEDYNTCEGAFGALQKICEDSAEILDSDVLDRPLNIMIPKFLQFFKHSSPKIRRQWAQTETQKVPSEHQETLFYCESDQALAQVAYTGDGVCILGGNTVLVPVLILGSVLVMHTIHIESLKNSFDKPYVFKKWYSERTDQLWVFLSAQLFELLIPVLVNGMKYSEIDIILLKGDVEEDEAIPDSEQDIRPRFHRSRTVAQQHEEDGIEDDDDDDDELDDDDTISDWNL
ncbi:Transportin-1, partial [Phoenicopterus ruber ruber]